MKPISYSYIKYPLTQPNLMWSFEKLVKIPSKVYEMFDVQEKGFQRLLYVHNAGINRY